jgi:hypothetical protein
MKKGKLSYDHTFKKSSVGKPCGVAGWWEPKNPFRLPRDQCLEGEPVTLEEGELPSEGVRNTGRSHNLPFLFLLYHRLLDHSSGMSL